MILQELYYLYTMKTNNFRDPQLPKKFEELWDQAAGLFQLEESIYAIYHDYESDYKGDYAVSIALERPLDGAKSLTVPKQDYAIFSTTREEIPQTWQKIWHLEEAGQLSRLYQLDFEKYDPDGKASIYIGVKKEVGK